MMSDNRLIPPSNGNGTGSERNTRDSTLPELSPPSSTRSSFSFRQSYEPTATILQAISASGMEDHPQLQHQERQEQQPQLCHDDFLFSMDDFNHSDAMYIDLQLANSPRIVTDTINNQLLNVHLQASLRKGETAVQLFTKRYIGYIISGALAAYMNVMIECVLLRLPTNQLGIDEIGDLQALVNLQWSSVLVLGVLSDGYAPFCLRRKSYVTIGWISSFLLWITLFFLFEFSIDIFGTAVPPQAIAMTFIPLATISLLLSTMGVDIRVIELSQQEELPNRCKVLALYLLVRMAAQVFADLLILVIPSAEFRHVNGSLEEEGNVELTLPFSMSTLLLHIAIMTLIPIPCLLFYAYEDFLGRASASLQIWRNFKRFWQFAQQQAVWGLAVVNCLLSFFLLFDYTPIRNALRWWTEERAQNQLLRRSLSDVAVFLVLLLWRLRGLNTNWKFTIAIVVGSWCLVSFTGYTLVAFDQLRYEWLLMIVHIAKAGVRVVLVLAIFIPAIEVGQIGLEGTIYGLMSSIQYFMQVLGHQVEVGVLKAAPSLELERADILRSTTSTEMRAFWTILVTTGIALLSLLALWLVPKHKLALQQLRIHGGYNVLVLSVLSVGYAASFIVVTYLQIRECVD